MSRAHHESLQELSGEITAGRYRIRRVEVVKIKKLSEQPEPDVENDKIDKKRVRRPGKGGPWRVFISLL